MARELVFTAPKGKKLVFDTYENNTEEYGIYWVDMCPTCHRKYRSILGKRCLNDNSGLASCSVKGCTRINSTWYVDFRKEEVTITA